MQLKDTLKRLFQMEVNEAIRLNRPAVTICNNDMQCLLDERDQMKQRIAELETALRKEKGEF